MLDGSMGRGQREARLGFIWVVCYMRIFCVGPYEVRHTRPTTTRMLRRVVVAARLALQEAKSAVFFFLGEFRAIFNAAVALVVFKE